MPSLLGSDDHWFTLAVASIIIGVSYGVYSVPWYWALTIGMIVSGILEFAIKEIPPDTDEYNPNQYQLWDKGFGDSQDSSESTGRGTGTETDGSIGALRTRYARGEITDEQFEQKVEKLLETESLDEPTDREKAQDVLTERDE